VSGAGKFPEKHMEFSVGGILPSVSKIAKTDGVFPEISPAPEERYGSNLAKPPAPFRCGVANMRTFNRKMVKWCHPAGLTRRYLSPFDHFLP
jgi:hypothetical protein